MTVETWRGTVTLTGRAVSEAEKAKAEEIARGVKNVKTVRNYIDVVGAAIPVQKVAKEDKPFSKPTGKYTKTQDISLPVVSATPTTSAASATTSTQPSTTPSVTETTIEEPSATTTAFESKAATKSVPELSEAELANAPSTGHENAVSHEIKKELAMTTEETKTQSVDDVTLQAEQELKALKAKKRSK
jgi:hypothetical protein